jgi:hypothetical protein
MMIRRESSGMHDIELDVGNAITLKRVDIALQYIGGYNYHYVQSWVVEGDGEY